MKVSSFFSSVPFFRVFTRAIKGFINDGCSLKAAALTYYTMFSLVPVAAVLFGLAKGFGLGEIFINSLKELLQDHQEIATKVIEYVNHALDHAKGGLIAGLGVLLLFWAVYMLLMSIEQAFNEIWRTSSQRTFFRMLSDYLAVVIICPILLLVSSSLSLYLTSTLSEFATKTGTSDYVNPFIKVWLHLTPLLSSWLLFTFLYLFIPNKTVHIRYALSAGILAGSAFQLLQYAFIKLQLWFASYGAIYGSFAVFPLFLIWMQFSWWIALFGAEICYHASLDKKESAHLKLLNDKTITVKRGVLALFLMSESIKKSLAESPPPTLLEFAKMTGVSYEELKKVMDDLKNAALVWETGNNSDETCYNIAKSMDRIKISHVLFATGESSKDEIKMVYSNDLFKITEIVYQFKEDLNRQKTNYSLYELAELLPKGNNGDYQEKSQVENEPAI